MNDIIAEAEAHWRDVFALTQATNIADGCKLARSEMPKLITVAKDFQQKFEAVSFLLMAFLQDSGGSVVIDKNTIELLRQKSKGMAIQTAMEVEELSDDKIRVILKQESAFEDGKYMWEGPAV